ncbi:MAG TPA: hypothetical protein VFX37_07455, partial [Pseudolabrys sp.]|nr:hypothetical protein [Pseudolabrys sp.]
MAVPKTNWVVNLRSRKHFVALLAGCAIAGPTLFADPAAAGCNSGNNANTDLLSSANCQAGATGNGSTAVGAGAFASGGNGTALGASAVADGLNSTSAGTNASSLVEGATSVGAFAGLLVGSGGTGIYSTSIGAGVNPGLNPAAVTSAQAFGDFSIAIGGGNTGNAGAIANGVGSVAIGNQSSV